MIQLADNQSYTQTQAVLHVVAPVEIVFARSQVDRVLCRTVVAAWGGGGEAAAAGGSSGPGTTFISTLSRKLFDDEAGLAAVQALAARCNVVDFTGKYLALASVAALIKYIEVAQHVTLADRSVQFTWRAAVGRMAMDYETIKALELVANSRTGSPGHSLLGVVDHTMTATGRRLLRAQVGCRGRRRCTSVCCILVLVSTTHAAHPLCSCWRRATTWRRSTCAWTASTSCCVTTR